MYVIRNGAYGSLSTAPGVSVEPPNRVTPTISAPTTSAAITSTAEARTSRPWPRLPRVMVTYLPTTLPLPVSHRHHSPASWHDPGGDDQRGGRPGRLKGEGSRSSISMTAIGGRARHRSGCATRARCGSRGFARDRWSRTSSWSRRPPDKPTSTTMVHAPSNRSRPGTGRKTPPCCDSPRSTWRCAVSGGSTTATSEPPSTRSSWPGPARGRSVSTSTPFPTAPTRRSSTRTASPPSD